MMMKSIPPTENSSKLSLFWRLTGIREAEEVLTEIAAVPGVALIAAGTGK